jgi:hypothetical protein
MDKLWGIILVEARNEQRETSHVLTLNLASHFSLLVSRSRFSFLIFRFSYLVSHFSFLISRFSFLVSRFCTHTRDAH